MENQKFQSENCLSVKYQVHHLPDTSLRNQYHVPSPKPCGTYPLGEEPQPSAAKIPSEHQWSNLEAGKNLSVCSHVCDELNFNASKKVKIAWKDAAISALSFRSTLLVSDKGIPALLMIHIQTLDKIFFKSHTKAEKKTTLKVMHLYIAVYELSDFLSTQDTIQTGSTHSEIYKWSRTLIKISPQVGKDLSYGHVLR